MNEPHIPAGFGVDRFADQTNVHPVGLAVLLVLGLALLLLPRRYAAIPVLLMAALIPSAQRIAIVTLDFTFLRILVIFGVLRIFSRGEYRDLRRGSLDSVFVAWVLISSAISVLRAGFGAVIYECGVAYDALGMYFIFRCVLRRWDDVAVLARACALVALPVAAAFFIEQATQRNLFAFFGGVHEITTVREGRLRCQGPYSHPILAGCFWAILLPLIAARWWTRGARYGAIAGTAAGLIIVYCCASSTPVLGVAAGLIAAAAFLVRRRLRAIRWAVVLALVALHLMMKAPVWNLIARVSAVGGSTAWHRFHLLDQFIRRFPEWAIVGTNSTAHWGYFLFDITNYYVAQGVAGGVLRLGLFIAIMVLAFRAIGQLARSAESDPSRLALAWALGVAFFAQAACFIGVSYFGQITTLWYLFPAVIASLEQHELCIAAHGVFLARPAPAVRALGPTRWPAPD